MGRISRGKVGRAASKAGQTTGKNYPDSGGSEQNQFLILFWTVPGYFWWLTLKGHRFGKRFVSQKIKKIYNPK